MWKDLYYQELRQEELRERDLYGLHSRTDRKFDFTGNIDIDNICCYRKSRHRAVCGGIKGDNNNVGYSAGQFER